MEHIFATVSLVVFPLCCEAQAITTVVGVMYFGNGGGLLSFDGMSWSLHKLPQDKTVRSVFTDEGLIYVGSYEEFGFFEKAADGSFIGNVRREPAVNGNVWDISTFDGQTFIATSDNGTIAPTAALSSFPYTPDESMAALKYFYYILGDKIWGDYGFYDSFNLDSRWFASSYIAIDQGPIVIMIENYRSGLLWDCFMQNEDVKFGLTKLGFSYTE